MTPTRVGKGRLAAQQPEGEGTVGDERGAELPAVSAEGRVLVAVDEGELVLDGVDVAYAFAASQLLDGEIARADGAGDALSASVL